MINISQVYKIYQSNKNNEVLALNNVSLQIEKGDMVAIIGTSGSGKSTLLHCLAGMEKFEKGMITVDGYEINKLSEQKLSMYRNSTIGIVLQDFALIPEYTVYENVTIPLLFSRTNDKSNVNNVLKLVGMQEYINKKVNQLSGGQKQRVAIARAIVNNPSYILADEPTGALDSKTSKDIMNLFSEINRQGTTVIIVTHDLNVASQCKKTIRIEDGTIFN